MATICQKEYFLAVILGIGYKKNMSFLVIPKSPKVWKEVKKIGWAPLSGHCGNKQNKLKKTKQRQNLTFKQRQIFCTELNLIRKFDLK